MHPTAELMIGGKWHHACSLNTDSGPHTAPAPAGLLSGGGLPFAGKQALAELASSHQVAEYSEEVCRQVWRDEVQVKVSSTAPAGCCMDAAACEPHVPSALKHSGMVQDAATCAH